MIKKYQQKPVIIEAVQWLGTQESLNEVIVFCRHEAITHGHDNTINVITVDGIMNAAIGDFILRDANGKYYVCKPDVFAATYVEVLDLTNIIPESGTEKIYNAAIQAMKDYSEKEK